MYHRIDRPNASSKVAGHYVSPALFERQIRAMLALGYRSAPLSDVFAAAEPPARKTFCVTFDDGYENFFTNALPVLQRLNGTATVFLVTDMVGKDNAWDADRGDVRERLLSREQVLECQAAGTDFGSHTLSHVDLSACDDDGARREIVGSKAAVESITGKPARAFCYPYGRFKPDTPSLVREAGYETACSTLKGLNDASTDRYALRRINVRRDTSVTVLTWKLLRGAILGR